MGPSGKQRACEECRRRRKGCDLGGKRSEFDKREKMAVALTRAQLERRSLRVGGAVPQEILRRLAQLEARGGGGSVEGSAEVNRRLDAFEDVQGKLVDGHRYLVDRLEPVSAHHDTLVGDVERLEEDLETVQDQLQGMEIKTDEDTKELTAQSANLMTAVLAIARGQGMGGLLAGSQPVASGSGSKRPREDEEEDEEEEHRRKSRSRTGEEELDDEALEEKDADPDADEEEEEDDTEDVGKGKDRAE